MAKLTADAVRGIWAALPLSWDDRDRLDEDVYWANAERIARVDDRYIIGTPDARFVDHCRLLARFDGKTPIVETIDAPGAGASEFIVVTPPL